MQRKDRQRGFSLIELLTAITIIGLLASIATMAYQKYIVSAGADDLIAKHHELRNKAIAVMAGLDGAMFDDCDEMVARFGQDGLADRYARIGYGLEAVTGGFRPVLTVCASEVSGSALGVKVARRAYDKFAAAGVVESNPVLLDSLVSYSLLLFPDDKPMCKSARSGVASVCGSAQPAQPQAQAQPQPQAPAQPPAQAQPQDQAKADDCEDTYGSTCDLDFGSGMCGEAFVQEMCKKFCGVCGGGSIPSRAMRMGSTPEAPQVPQDLGKPAFHVVSAGQTVPLDVDALLQQLQPRSPDGQSPIRVTAIRVTSGAWSKDLTPFQDQDGRWQLRAASNFQSGNYYNVEIVLDNGHGEITVPVSFSGR